MLGVQGPRLGGIVAPTPAAQQPATLRVDTRGLAAGRSYSARLTVVTNGGGPDSKLSRKRLIPRPASGPT